MPLAALVVSTAAVIVAIQAKDISNRQAEIAVRQLQPVITASLAYVLAGSKARDQVMTICTNGGPAASVRAEVATISSVQYEHVGQQVKALVPLEHYYTSTISSGSPTSVLATEQGSANNAREFALETGAAKLYATTHTTLTVDLRQYARVSYVNELGTNHMDYLLVDPVNGSSPLAASVGASALALQDRADSGAGPALDLDTLTPRGLLAFMESRRR